MLWTGETHWVNLPIALEEAINSEFLQGRMLRKATSLCQWDSGFYFAQSVAMTRWQGSATYAWNIWPNGPLTDILVREVSDGMLPVSLTTAASNLFFQPPSSRSGILT
jgi:hypothetical protein